MHSLGLAIFLGAGRHSPALRLLSASLEGNHIVQETVSTRGPWCLPWGLCLKDMAPALHLGFAPLATLFESLGGLSASLCWCCAKSRGARGEKLRDFLYPAEPRLFVFPGSSLSAWRGCPSRVSGFSLDVLHSEPASPVTGARRPPHSEPASLVTGARRPPPQPLLSVSLLVSSGCRQPCADRGAAALLDSPPALLCGAFPWHILKRGDRGAVLMAVARFPPR